MSRTWASASELTGGLTADQLQDDARFAERVAADDAHMLERCVRIQRCLTFHHDEWKDLTACPWQKVADLLGLCMARPDAIVNEDWHDELQQFATEYGWPTIWICYAQAMSRQITDATR